MAIIADINCIGFLFPLFTATFPISRVGSLKWLTSDVRSEQTKPSVVDAEDFT